MNKGWHSSLIITQYMYLIEVWMFWLFYLQACSLNAAPMGKPARTWKCCQFVTLLRPNGGERKRKKLKPRNQATKYNRSPHLSHLLTISSYPIPFFSTRTQLNIKIECTLAHIHHKKLWWQIMFYSKNSRNKKTAHGKEILSYSKARPRFERRPQCHIPRTRY